MFLSDQMKILGEDEESVNKQVNDLKMKHEIEMAQLEHKISMLEIEMQEALMKIEEF